MGAPTPWSDEAGGRYAYLDCSASRPASAVAALVRDAQRPVSATFSVVRAALAYEPRVPNQPTALTVAFAWGRPIDPGDVFVLPLPQLRAGADRDTLDAAGPAAQDLALSWQEAPRTLTFRAARAIPAGAPVAFTVPASEGLRLPIKHAGRPTPLDDEAAIQARAPPPARSEDGEEGMMLQHGRHTAVRSHSPRLRPRPCLVIRQPPSLPC